jgi:single-strand DNA-binding protein
MGRLTRDPELRRTGSGVAVASFCLAVDRDFNKDGEKKTDFIDCNAWRGLGEFVSKYFQKGSMAVVSGRLEIREWTDKDGNKRRNAEVVADSVYFGDSKKSDQGNSTYQAPNAYQGEAGGFPESMALIEKYQSQGKLAYSAPHVQSDFAMLDDDDAQLPF